MVPRVQKAKLITRRLLKNILSCEGNQGGGSLFFKDVWIINYSQTPSKEEKMQIPSFRHPLGEFKGPKII